MIKQTGTADVQPFLPRFSLSTSIPETTFDHERHALNSVA